MLKRLDGVAVGQLLMRMPAPLAALPNFSFKVIDGLKHSMPRGRAAMPAEPEVLGRIGRLEVRLATSSTEIKKAQRLRYQIFYEEMSAIADLQTQLSRRDRDGFDKICDHLLVIDHDNRTQNGEPTIVGTYRLLRQDIAARHTGFYSASEFNIAPLLARHPQMSFLELGRSCVMKPYRTKRTVELLWRGIWSYVQSHGIDVMIGCASLEGTDPERLAMPLSFLHHNARAPAEWSVAPHRNRSVQMDRLAAGEIDTKAALHALPPLIKGYLRIGAYVGDGAVIDRQFHTTDVMIVMPVAAIGQRYIDHYSVDGARYAA